MERIISGNVLNPYHNIKGPKNEPVIIFTTSEIRRELARSFGVPVCGEDIHGQTELKTQNNIGEGNITAMQRDKNSPLIPLEIAVDKAQAVVDYYSKLGEKSPTFATVDSAWGVVFKDRDGFLIHKPKNEEEIEKTIRLLYEASSVEAEFQSITSLTVYRDGEYHTYLIKVKFGTLNPNASWGALEQRLRDNSHNAAGFNTFDLLSKLNLVKFRDFIEIEIEEYVNEKNKQRKCHVTERLANKQILRYAYDQTNYEIIAGFSVGVLPLD